jgi:hypothetical protein
MALLIWIKLFFIKCEVKLAGKQLSHAARRNETKAHRRQSFLLSGLFVCLMPMEREKKRESV